MEDVWTDLEMSTEMIVAIFSGLATLLGIWVQLQLAIIKANVAEIKVHTNSMKDQLVLATAQASHAEGKAEGKAEEKAEEETESSAGVKS